MVKRDSPPILKEEKCWNCGKSVAWGSGRYVNRIPSLDSVEVRRENGAPHPEGEYLCSECEGEFEKGEIRCQKCGAFADPQKDGTNKCQLGCGAVAADQPDSRFSDVVSAKLKGEI